MRRIVDIAAALFALIVLAPVFAGIAIVIWAGDGSPILFRQKRVGRGGRPFQILKFRTMRPDASGGSITVAGDRRVTRVGRWLRRFKLDELPQFFNVLRGDMSLIGPRPEVSEYVDLADPVWQEVLSVRPGITDVATLTYRDEEHLLSSATDSDIYYREVVLPAKLKLNLLYGRGRRIAADVRLLWLTMLYSLRPERFERDSVLGLLRPHTQEGAWHAFRAPTQTNPRSYSEEV
jgi:lipopolysaccharide/colanic/teichoic acid biosynthesis glycosyltransferase